MEEGVTMKRGISKYILLLLMTFLLTFQTGCTFYSYDTSGLNVESGGSSSSSKEENKKPSIEDTTSPSDSNTQPPTEPPSSPGIDEPPVIEEDETNNNLIINSPSAFSSGFITSQKTNIETEHFIFEIEANVYVPDYLEEYIEVIYNALEKASGLSFYNTHYNPDKIVIEVAKPNNPKYPDSEMAGAYAYSKGATIHISSGDLLLGNSYAIVHELSHILQYSQSSWSYSRVYVEGFAEYNSYNTIKYLEKNNIEVAKSTIANYSHINNMTIYGDVYSKSVEYWIANESEAYDISGNGPYSIGMRFMNYLHDTYNDYTSWIKYYERINPYYTNKYVDQKIPLNSQYEAMKNTYGFNVFDGFYNWLKQNEETYERPSGKIYDLKNLKYTYIYPEFNAIGGKVYLSDYAFTYNNLYIYIDATRYYLKEYKGKSVSNLKLELASSVTVEFYNSDGTLLSTKTGTSFSLVGVGYIKLLGEGTLGNSNTEGLEIIY